MLPGAHLLQEYVPDFDEAMEGPFLAGQLQFLADSVLGSFLQTLQISRRLKSSKPWHWSLMRQRPRTMIKRSLIRTEAEETEMIRFVSMCKMEI